MSGNSWTSALQTAPIVIGLARGAASSGDGLVLRDVPGSVAMISARGT